MKRISAALFAVLTAVGLVVMPHGSAEAAPAAPELVEVVEYNEFGFVVAHHGLMPANTWVGIATSWGPGSGINNCSGSIRMGTFGDGYADFRTTDVDCDGRTGVAVQTAFFGETPWSPAGCTLRNARNGSANPDFCHRVETSTSWQITATMWGSAFMMKVQVCTDMAWDPFYICSPTQYYGFIPH
jgi:hypothetical protein